MLRGLISKALIVTQSEAERLDLMVSLTNAGCFVREATSMEGALDATAVFQPDLVIFDLALSQGCVDRFVHTLREVSDGDVLVLGLTSARDLEGADLDELLQRPVSSADLLQVAHRLARVGPAH